MKSLIKIIKAKLVIFSLIMIALLVIANDSDIYNTNKIHRLHIEYDNGQFNLLSNIIMEGAMSEETLPELIKEQRKDSLYRLELVSGNNIVVVSEFLFSPYIYVDIINPKTREISGGPVKLDKTEFLIGTPYSENVNKINIYGPSGNLVLAINTAEASECGNSICEDGEDYFSCAIDCKSGSRDDYCDKEADNLCDPDCLAGLDIDCGPFDETAPTITISNVPALTNQNVSPVIEARDDYDPEPIIIVLLDDFRYNTPIIEEGTHTLTITAQDYAGNKAEKVVTFIIDKTPPEVNIEVDRTEIWPPNHKKIDIKVDGYATDALSGIASKEIKLEDEYNIYSKTLEDFSNTKVEAWREGNDKDGRQYTITLTATDNAGNIAITRATVVVPHDQRNSKNKDE